MYKTISLEKINTKIRTFPVLSPNKQRTNFHKNSVKLLVSGSFGLPTMNSFLSREKGFYFA
ncbi:MAG TPA: hypothetical protein VK105_06670, partial [Virgibacillus sp.]